MSRVLLALPVVLAGVAAGCGSGGKSAATTTIRTVTVTTPPIVGSVTTHGRYHYPKVVIDNFMRSCMRGNVTRQAYCGCTLDKLSNNISVRAFARIGLSGGRLPPRIRRFVTQAAIDCANKL